ncbi:hypothetical protein [Bosea massiliensis]|uniref:Ketopantoate reductase C-terminal domain-containing protein n=1 Tax=Bosea massiliensis TaxID=151419 RepID=A0ABW0P8G5_9HYPH
MIAMARHPLTDPALLDALLEQHDICQCVINSIDGVRSEGMEPTPENMVDAGMAAGFDPDTCLLLSALVARHLGSEGRG